MAQARGFFERALELDPANVGAMVGMATVDATVGATFMSDDRTARLAAAEVASIKALSLAPSHAGAHTCLGFVQMVTNRADQGIGEYARALALDRNSANAHALIGFAKYFLGRGAETETHIQEAFRLSPRDPLASRWMVWVGFAKAQLNDYTEAVAWLRRGLEANRNSSITHFSLAAYLARLASWTKRGPPSKQDLSSIRASPSTAFAPGHSATIRPTSPGASVPLRGCV